MSLVHTIWLGGQAPETFVPTLDACFSKHEHWDDERVASVPLIQAAADSRWSREAREAGHLPAAKDPIRFAILYAFGGWYSDLDIKWMRDPEGEPWFRGDKAIAGFEDTKYLCNAVIYAPPRHPRMAELVQIYADKKFEKVSDGEGGPSVLTRFRNEHPADFKCPEPDVFYPLHWHTRELRITPRTVCVHYYDQSQTAWGQGQ